VLLSPAAAWAQPTGEPVAGRPLVPEDRLGRGTPRGTIEGFRRAADAADFETAAEFLDLRNLPEDIRRYSDEQIALGLKVVLDRALWIDLAALSDDPDGNSGDGLPRYRDELGVIEHKGEKFQLLLQRVPREDGERIWKISNATIAQLPRLYEIYRYPGWIENLAKALPRVSFLGIELFKWLILIGFVLVAYPALYGTGTLAARYAVRGGAEEQQRVRRFLAGPLAWWLIALGVHWLNGELGRGATAQALSDQVPLRLIVTVWVLWALSSMMRDIASGRLEAQGRPGAALLLRPLTNAVKLVIVVAGILVWLDNLGFSITTILAGLGVGGIAVALALQKPLEDVFGAINIYAQGLVRIGDFCRVGQLTGSVEEIGLRSTRIRTLANTVVAIPNSRLASEPIDNISARRKIWFNPLLRLRLDTSPDQVRDILTGVRALLANDARVLEEGARVRFQRFGEQGLELQVSAYINTVDWPLYLEIAEDLNLRILDIVIGAGAALALPIDRVGSPAR